MSEKRKKKCCLEGHTVHPKAYYPAEVLGVNKDPTTACHTLNFSAGESLGSSRFLFLTTGSTGNLSFERSFVTLLKN
jgi:hypothetical protein